MKKFVLIILAIACLTLCGCSYSGTALVQNANGSISEYYYVAFPQQQFLANGVTATTLNKIVQDVKQNLDTEYFGAFINKYQAHITKNENYTYEQKIQLINGVTFTSNLPKQNEIIIGYLTEIQYEIKFANSTCYSEFKKANSNISEEKIIETKNNLFTTVTIVKKDPIVNTSYKDAINVGNYFLNLVNSIMSSELGTVYWQQLKDELNYDEYSSKIDYTYVVPTGRIHSNADTVEQKSNGYYYHTWQIDLNSANQTFKIEYYTVQANKWVWYVLTLVGAVLIVIITLIVAKNKDKKETQKIKNQISF